MGKGNLNAGQRSGDGPGGTVPVRGRQRFMWAFVGVLALAVIAAAFAPVGAASREELFEIPEGTWKRRMAGDKVDILPQTI